MLGSGLNLVTTLIGFGMSATFIVFICARLICGRIRSTDSQPATFDIELRSDLDPQEHRINGLEAVEVAAIPTVKYSCESFESKQDAQCSICLGDYQEKEILRVMPTCHHNFHLACIDVWLQKQSTCPICRLPLNDTLGAPPMFIPNSLELSSDLPNQWLIPSHQRSEAINDTTRGIDDSVTLDIGVLHSEPETGT